MISKLDQARVPKLVGLGAAVLATIACWVEVARLSLLKRFSIDEFQYAHAAWLVSHGKLPYRDFFEFHFPLPYLIYSFFVSDSPGSIAHLRLFMLACFALTSFGLYRLNRERGVALALTAPIAAATATPFTFFATEIRPDAVAFALFVNALACLRPAQVTRVRAMIAGILWVLALFATQKTLIYSAPLGVLLLVDVIRARAPWRARWLESWVPLALSMAGTVLAITLYFLITHSGAAWFQQTLIWAAYHEKHYPGFPWTNYGLPALEAASVLVALGLIGAARTSYELSQSRALLAEPDLVLVLVLGSALFSFGFARAPFPYALLPGLGMLAVFVPRAFTAIFSLLRRVPVSPLVFGLEVAMVLLFVGLLGIRAGLQRSEQKLETTNASQYQVLTELARVTRPTDAVYDNSGSFVSRPHVGFRFYTSALDRQEEASSLPIKVPQAIRELGCTAILIDARFSGLPPVLRRFFAQHYLPYDADIWLWGQRFSTNAGVASFEAVRDADYFVEPERVVTNGAFSIDGAPVSTPMFHLSRGVHRFEYTGTERQYSVAWLPADGVRYQAKFGLHPAFSSIF